MICNLIRCCLFFVPICLYTSRSSGEVMFDLRSTASPAGSIVNNVFTLTKIGLTSGGVTFDAILTVTGNKAFVATSPTGMGTGLDAGDNSMGTSGGNDVLQFTMLATNFAGGSVVFNGFNRVYLSSFTLGETAGLNQAGGIGETINFPVVSPSLASPQYFTISAQSGSFQVSQVDALFTGTAAAVPEPATFGALGMVACMTPLLRRFRRRGNSIDSGAVVL